METNWATEHLQTIRTLMERSALYRRALAPIMTFVGVIGIAAAAIGGWLHIENSGKFALFWMIVGTIAVTGSLLLVRRQATKQGENFWSPPTRRVTQALAPALLIGLLIGCLVIKSDWEPVMSKGGGDWFMLSLAWAVLYGLALHAAGFFMPRGIRWFGLGFLLASAILLTAGVAGLIGFFPEPSPHVFMGLLFGVSHLAYGIYLYFTERKNAA